MRDCYLKPDFIGHLVSTVEEAGLKGLKNGALLQAANSEFDVLVTVDQNIPYQQNLQSLSIAIMILIGKTNKYADLKPLVGPALEELKSVMPGDVVRVEVSETVATFKLLSFNVLRPASQSFNRPLNQ